MAEMTIEDGRVVGCGTIIMKDNKILLGRRSDGQGWCLAGGKVDKGETPEQAAVRELYEEFGVTAGAMSLVGVIETSSIIRGNMRDVYSHIYVANEYLMPKELKINREMLAFQWVSAADIVQMVNVFTPTRQAIQMYIDKQVSANG